MGRKKKYQTEEERKAALKEIRRKASKKYMESHPLETRAKSLIYNYKKEDKKYDRELPDFDAKWMVENILLKPCHYCGKEGWDVIGCDRIDNSIGHIKTNVVPSCLHCNMIKPKEEEWKGKYAEKRKKPILMFNLNGDFLKEYPSIKDASEDLNISHSCISRVLTKIRKHTKELYFEYKK